MPKTKELPKGIADLETADQVFTALAHSARRQILLSVHYRKEATAGEIAKRFDCSWPTISRHLAVLVESGLLKAEKRGRERLYTTNAAMLEETLAAWAKHFSS